MSENGRLGVCVNLLGGVVLGFSVGYMIHRQQTVGVEARAAGIGFKEEAEGQHADDPSWKELGAGKGKRESRGGELRDQLRDVHEEQDL